MSKPKKKCCVTKPRCTRCPLRMLTEGTLPDGYTVKRRRLVRLQVIAGGNQDKNKQDRNKQDRNKQDKNKQDRNKQDKNKRDKKHKKAA